MSILDRVHGEYVFGRRVRVLARHIADLLPAGASVLDVGCGDGSIARAVMDMRADVRFEGIDVLVRPTTHIPVAEFDGRRIPREDASVDVALFVDVLHHTEDPTVLLREAARVSLQAVMVKDHLLDGVLAGPTLRFMDWVGNARHGVVLPYNYWPQARWEQAAAELGLTREEWRASLGLYPAWADWLFGRGLHFIARWGVTERAG